MASRDGLTLNRLWHGNRRLLGGFRQLLWSVICFFLSGRLWTMSLPLVFMPETYRRIGLVLALISLGLLLLGFWKIWSALREAGLKGVLLILATIFVALFLFNLLTYPEPVPVQDRLYPTLVKNSQQLWGYSRNIGLSLARALEDFRFAYVGSNAGTYLPGFPQPDPNAQPILVSAKPATAGSSSLKPGGYATLNTAVEASLACYSTFDPKYSQTVMFGKRERLLILSGPRLEDEQGSWWQVHGDKGDAWCHEEILASTR